LVFNKGCHEDHKVYWDQPLRFDELEVEEIEVSDLKSCWVPEGFEQRLIQEGCPN